MKEKKPTFKAENQIKTFRWLFHLSLFSLALCFIAPIIIFPTQILLSVEILNALTVGLLFGIYFLGVNIYGLVIDKKRRLIYVGVIIFITAWILWAVISWFFIEHMDYLN